MGLVNLPHLLTDGTNAYGSQVKANDDSIVTQVNGNLDNANIKSGANIDASKLLAQSVTSTQLATSSVTTVKIAPDAVDNTKLADSCVNAEQLNNEGVGEEGLGTPRNELYTGSGQDGAGGYPGTNVLANRKQQSGKTVWAYFNIGTAATDYLIDASIDWRRRIITIHMLMQAKAGGSAKTTLPGGANDDLIASRMWFGDPPAITETVNTYMFYSEAGGDGTVAPRLFLEANMAANDDTGWIWVDSATGQLKMKMDTFNNASVDVLAQITCSPYLGT